MPRTARIAPGGQIYHVLNRGVGRMNLFDTDADFAAFHRCMLSAAADAPMPILAYCLMRNHWHLVVHPQRDGDLARFMLRLTVTHVRRWQEFRQCRGTGHIYQGRYKSFLVESDSHFLTVARYVERNPVRARLVRSAARWRWSSLGQTALAAEMQIPLAAWPVKRPPNWLARVNAAETSAEIEALRQSVQTGRPFGSDGWRTSISRRLGWREPRPVGRPRKGKESRAVPVI